MMLAVAEYLNVLHEDKIIFGIAKGQVILESGVQHFRDFIVRVAHPFVDVLVHFGHPFRSVLEAFSFGVVAQGNQDTPYMPFDRLYINCHS
ncbi:hypothetical protein SDC9_171048 [bioreactor metagenome]|uniref:Uncharacterized protein n=1 Tax=bioreactor metagenome TaxID=1076179 RepID=A0A645GAJ4_9ZZZZ